MAGSNLKSGSVSIYEIEQVFIMKGLFKHPNAKLSRPSMHGR